MGHGSLLTELDSLSGLDAATNGCSLREPCATLGTAADLRAPGHSVTGLIMRFPTCPAPVGGTRLLPDALYRAYTKLRQERPVRCPSDGARVAPDGACLFAWLGRCYTWALPTGAMRDGGHSCRFACTRSSHHRDDREISDLSGARRGHPSVAGREVSSIHEAPSGAARSPWHLLRCMTTLSRTFGAPTRGHGSLLTELVCSPGSDPATIGCSLREPCVTVSTAADLRAPGHPITALIVRFPTYPAPGGGTRL